MIKKACDGPREAALKLAAAATATIETARRARAATIRDAIEGAGANYVKVVVYERGFGAQGVEIQVPRHVLIYLFTPGEEGERVAEAWLEEAHAVHGGQMRASVWAPCTFALAVLPVIGETMRSKAQRQRAAVDAGTYESERAARKGEEAA